jgi:maleylpyruvate isomerase
VKQSETAHGYLDGVRRFHDTWALAIGGFGEAELRAPSALPGWTRAHLVTHVARNADGLRNLLTWANTGVETPMYASAQARDDEIEAGATRSAVDILADFAAASAKFTEYAESMPDDAWAASVRNRQGAAVEGVVVARMRLSETAIHLADLDHGYDLDRVMALLGAHAETIVAHAISARGNELPALRLSAVAEDGTSYTWRMGVGEGPVVTGTCGEILGWVSGRTDGSALDGEVPRLPPWS